MDRRRRDNIPAIAAEIDALCQPNTIADQAAGVREIEVAPSPARYCLNGRRQQPELALQAFARDIAAMFRINIKHDKI